jgi:RimJ/RimL family protein N-acetyltransferase
MELNVDGADGAGVRLFLLRPEHVTATYVSWLNDTDVSQYLESRFAVHSEESTRAFVQAMLDSPDNLFMGIHNATAGGHVGNIKIGPINRRHGTGEIGILIGEKRAWGKGIATAAILLVCRVAREHLALRKLTAGCYASNTGSRRAFEKAGFEVEGVRRHQLLLGDRPEDLILLGRLL